MYTVDPGAKGYEMAAIVDGNWNDRFTSMRLPEGYSVNLYSEMAFSST